MGFVVGLLVGETEGRVEDVPGGVVAAVEGGGLTPEGIVVGRVVGALEPGRTGVVGVVAGLVVAVEGGTGWVVDTDVGRVTGLVVGLAVGRMVGVGVDDPVVTCKVGAVVLLGSPAEPKPGKIMAPIRAMTSMAATAPSQE